jgi:flagellar biosynthesis GTPase FlhF
MLTVKVVDKQARDKLGIFSKADMNKALRLAITRAADNHRDREYPKRFVSRIVYATPYNYQWGKYDRKGREIPIEKRTPLYFKGMHRKLYKTGKIVPSTRKGQTTARIPMPFGHPIPSKIPGSPAINEISRLVKYISPAEAAEIARVFGKSIVGQHKKLAAKYTAIQNAKAKKAKQRAKKAERNRKERERKKAMNARKRERIARKRARELPKIQARQEKKKQRANIAKQKRREKAARLKARRTAKNARLREKKRLKNERKKLLRLRAWARMPAAQRAKRKRPTL